MSTTRPSARGRGSFLAATPGSPTPPKKSGNQEKKKADPAVLVKANLQMRPELYKELKTYAVQRGVKVYEAVDEAIQAYLSERRSA